MENTVEYTAIQKSTPILDWNYARILPIITLLGSNWVFAPERQFSLEETILPLTLLWGGWLPFWYAILATDWFSALQVWQTWQSSTELSHWPYLQPHTPGAALHHRLEQAVDWWRNAGRQTLSPPLKKALLAIGISILLSSFLGGHTLILTSLFIAVTEIAVLWNEGKKHSSPGWVAFALIGLPWLLGAIVYKGDISQPLLSAFVLSFTIGLHLQSSAFTLIGPLIGIGYLIWQQHPLAAGGILLFALPGLQSRQPEHDTPTNHISFWLVMMVCTFIGAL